MPHRYSLSLNTCQRTTKRNNTVNTLVKVRICIGGGNTTKSFLVAVVLTIMLFHHYILPKQQEAKFFRVVVHAWTTVPIQQVRRQLYQYHFVSRQLTNLCGVYSNKPMKRQYHLQPKLGITYPVHTSYFGSTRTFATNELDADDDDDDNVPYDESVYYVEDHKNRSQWIVPKHIEIPEDRIGIRFVRSSGAGGQNVNKVSSCVQIRFHVLSAEWMGPDEVRQRFMQQYKNSITKHDGVYRLESQEYRTQIENRRAVIKKLEQNILAVWPRPKERKLRVGLTEKGKLHRKSEKIKQSTKKESRRNTKFDF